MIMNIFEMDYTRQEVAFMDLPADLDFRLGDTVIKVKTFDSGRLDAYLNVEYVIEPLVIPTYYLHGSIFMSVTPMETQSMWVAIERAKQAESVAMGGLGLGYAALRMCDPDNGGCIDYIDVYEQSADCIIAFTQLHENKPGFEKLNFILGDIYERCVGKSYDFMFNDIYQSTGQDEILTDIEFFCTKNDIREYRYWGQELMMMVATGNEEFDNFETVHAMRDNGILTFEDSQLFEMHNASEGSNLRVGFSDDEFAFACVEAHLDNQQGWE